MKLVLNKSKEGDECKVLLKDSDDKEIEFDYIKMIEMLYTEKKLDPTEFSEGFLDEEKESINNLVNDINNKVTEQFSLDAEEIQNSD